MKKSIFTILMLLLTVTAAWAGEGDGSKDHPFSGVWQASELASKIIQDKDLYLAYDCDIQNGSITVIDSKLNNKKIASNWGAWSPGNVLGSSNYSGYDEYYKANSLYDRKSQLFVITYASVSGSSSITMTGYFSGYYDYAGPVLTKKKVGDVEYYVINSADDYETFRQIVATGNPYANAVLENNINATEAIGEGSIEFHYRGTFDGKGHTVTLNLDNRESNKPLGMFAYTEPGCVIRNLRVSGKVYSTTSTHMGSIVGDATGTRIENCVSDAKVWGTSPNYGGLVGISRGECFLENCAYIGEMVASNQASGLVGVNSQMVSIKSCYVAPKYYRTGNVAHHGSMFADKMGDVETLLNSYYCDEIQDNKYLNVDTDRKGASSISLEKISNGHLCHSLNFWGRNGVVWYQHDVIDKDGTVRSLPFPFQGENGKLVTFNNISYTIGENTHEHNFSLDGVCHTCGALQPDRTITPLQNSGSDEMYATGDVYVGLLRYTLNKDSKTATVKGAHKLAKTERDYVNAIHIPETINYGGVEYTVKYIGKSSFNNSDMEYCYIPKTVIKIEDNAFNGCTKLKYLHIADCPSQSTTPDDKLWLGINEEKNEELFFNSPLEKVYIGRDLRWDTDTWTVNAAKPDEPFEDRNSITDVIFGPRVSRVGNYYDKENARKGWSYDLFNNCTGIQRVYIMGDDQSLNEKDLEFYCVDGLGYDNANDYYINRNIKHTDQWEFSLTSSINGCLDHCKHATYGPFVRKVTERSFKGQAANNNRWLETVDFTNAFRLETIGENAFNECTHLDCALDFSNTQLKEIEHDAFYNVDKVTSVNFGSHLQKVGAKAFNDSERITKISLPGTVTEVGSEAFGGMSSLATIRLEDGDGHINFTGSGSAFHKYEYANPLIKSRVAYIYQGRDYKYEGNTPFADCVKATSVTIGPKVTKLNFNGYKNIEGFSITFLHSPDALTFEDTPAEVFHESKVRGMFIDRQLRDKNGEHIDWSEGDDDEKYSTKKNVENLSFGDNIKAIPEHLFDHFSALKNVVIPASVTEIGKQAFIECENLEYLYIMGSAHIGREAFARCTNLMHLFLMGQTAKVDELVFDGCDKIEEVVTGFLEASENLAGSPEAFINTTYDNNDPRRTAVYDNAHLVCAGDTKTQKIDFGTIVPWKLFKSENRKSLLAANDYDIEEGDSKEAFYDHGYMPHSFTKDRYELVYAPFQMDSYYFGPKADIYKMSIENLSTENASFEDEYTLIDVDFTYKTDDLKFTKVDTDNEKLLSRGVYLVNTKTDKSLSNIASYHNLFKQQTVAVDNRSFFINGGSSSYSTASMSYNSTYPREETLIAIDDDMRCSFVCDGGVLKYVNGEYQPKVGEIVFKDIYEANKQSVFNMVDGKNTILSSKIDIPFNAILEGYASFYAAKTAGYNYIAPSWCDVYIVTSADGETVTLQKIEDRTINAGQAVLLKSNNEEKLADNLTEHLTFATNPSSASYEGNILKGVEVETPVSELGREFVYVLSRTSGNHTGFYKYNKTLNAGKAYLDPDGLSTENLAKSCLFTFKDTATGIKPMSESMSESVYDLMGRRLKEAGFNGIYIVNGKKVVIK